MTVGATTKAAAARAGAKATKKRTGWTKAKQRQFVELVAMTGKVRMAARAVGLSARSARALRQRDPAFDAAWCAAVEDGYGQMEEELLARALGQGSGDGGEDGAGTVAGFDPVLALKLLQMRGAGGRGPGGRGGGAKATPLATATSQEALDARLLERLDALAGRLAAQRLAARG